MTRCRTFRYRLHPTVRQKLALERQLNYQRELYNAALEERIGAWHWNRRFVGYFDQCRTLTDLVDVRPEVVASGVALCRGTLKRLDRAFGAFYRRVKNGETPGFPRFKSDQRFDSLQWEDRSGWKVKEDEHHLYLLGIGSIKANYHRALQGTPKAITVKREGTKWWLSVRCGHAITVHRSRGRNRPRGDESCRYKRRGVDNRRAFQLSGSHSTVGGPARTQ